MNLKSWPILLLSTLVTVLLLFRHHVYRHNSSYVLRFGALFGQEKLPITTILESGWDERASSIFQQTLTTLKYRKRTRVVRFPILSLTARVMDTDTDFWNALEKGTWEPDTFASFAHYITSNTTVIDVGTWIGPTVLFNSQLAGRTYGIEADPVAFARTLYNIKQNTESPWYNRVHLQAGCLGIKSSLYEMKSARPGNSMSSLSKIFEEQHHPTTVKWTVRCYTLSDIFRAWHIDPEVTDVFVKIDIESYECQVLPSLYPWLKKMRRKPSLFIAMHQQIAVCSNDQYKEIAKLASLYRFRTKSFINETGIVRGTGEFVLSDIMEPADA